MKPVGLVVVIVQYRGYYFDDLLKEASGEIL
jgi:hypothetical protein